MVIEFKNREISYERYLLEVCPVLVTLAINLHLSGWSDKWSEDLIISILQIKHIENWFLKAFEILIPAHSIIQFSRNPLFVFF